MDQSKSSQVPAPSSSSYPLLPVLFFLFSSGIETLFRTKLQRRRREIIEPTLEASACEAARVGKQ